MANKNQWAQTNKILFEYQVSGKMPQRYIYNVKEQQFYFEFDDEGPVKMDENEIQADIVAALKQLIK